MLISLCAFRLSRSVEEEEDVVIVVVAVTTGCCGCNLKKCCLVEKKYVLSEKFYSRCNVRNRKGA